jgi:hypothetical protein
MWVSRRSVWDLWCWTSLTSQWKASQYRILPSSSSTFSLNSTISFSCLPISSYSENLIILRAFAFLSASFSSFNLSNYCICFTSCKFWHWCFSLVAWKLTVVFKVLTLLLSLSKSYCFESAMFNLYFKSLMVFFKAVMCSS